MAVSSSLLRLRCTALWSTSRNFPSICTLKRSFVRINDRLAAMKPVELSSIAGLKPLRQIKSRNVGTVRQSAAAVTAASSDVSSSSSQFPRPASVAYEKSLANSVHLIGSVGFNPDIKYLDSGKIVATSSLSVKRSSGGDPTWFFLEFQSDLAEIAAQHVRQGDRIHVAGRIVVENVKDKDDVPQVLIKVEVTDLHFVEDVYGVKPLSEAGKQSTSPLSMTPSTPAEKRQASERLWKQFFANPDDWYDNRDNKRNPKAPDFKHKTTGEALWIDGFYVPSYVKDEIAELESKGVLKGSPVNELSSEGVSSSTSGRTLSVKKEASDSLWKQFFESPSDWYDNRDNKRNPKAPDFKHKATGEVLWIEGFHVPSYVKDGIAELESKGLLKEYSGTLSSSSSPPSTSSVGEFSPF